MSKKMLDPNSLNMSGLSIGEIYVGKKASVSKRQRMYILMQVL